MSNQILFLVLLIISLSSGCVNGKNIQQSKGSIVMATTTSTYDSGLLDYLLPVFEAKYGTEVKVISAGTGQALELGSRGDADVVLVHSPTDEERFVS